jgi:hypothetical protein
MGSERYLPIYLNDHLAAATAAAELTKRVRAAAEGELGELMQTLADEVEQDREALRDFMRTVGASEDKVKVFVGFTGEKLGRFKLNGHLVSPSPLSRLTELDGLRLLLEGKRSLWSTLREAGYDELDFAGLQARAADQLERVEPHRLEAARTSLGRES